jgi:hypothetical protein
MRGVRFALLIAAVALIGAGSAWAENYAQETLDRYFRIEYQVTPGATRPVMSGYVYNMNAGVSAERMQLSIEGLDASGNVVGTSSTWVLGGVPAGNRAYFTAQVMPASTYRVQVVAFEWGGRGGGSSN